MASVDEINTILKSDPIDLQALETALERADHATRLAATRAWNTGMQRRLFEAAEGREVPVEQILPTDAIGQEVIHEGTNTLPAFRQFQKRFCWVEESGERSVSGFNHGPGIQMWATTPGYYVAYPDPDGPEFVVDYRQMPTQKADAWPAIVDNSSRLGFFVFRGMVDRLRRVSDHVTIGRAYKKKPMNSWFVLVRDDSSFA